MAGKKLIIVLGMHRSGTSLLTKSLEVLGVKLGKDSAAFGYDNPKGFWEDKEIQKINEEVLEYIGIAWFDVKHIPSTVWQEEFWSSQIERAVELLREKMANVSVWGFKDPRSCLTVPFWEIVFSKLQLEVKYIVCIRNYESVARSLAARNSVTRNYSYALWFLYTYNALINSNYKKVIIRYESLLENPVDNIITLSKFCNQEIDKVKLEEYTNHYIDSNLNHSPKEVFSSSSPLKYLCQKLDELISCEQVNFQNNEISEDLSKSLDIIYTDFLILINDLERHSAIKKNHYDLELISKLESKIDELALENTDNKLLVDAKLKNEIERVKHLSEQCESHEIKIMKIESNMLFKLFRRLRIIK